VTDPQDAKLLPKDVRHEALHAAEQAVGRVWPVTASTATCSAGSSCSTWRSTTPKPT
jgi:hypothetical protein